MKMCGEQYTWHFNMQSVYGRRAHVSKGTFCVFGGGAHRHFWNMLGLKEENATRQWLTIHCLLSYCYIKLNCLENLLFILLFLFSLYLGIFFCSFASVMFWIMSLFQKNTSTKSKTPSAKSCCSCDLVYNYTAIWRRDTLSCS